MPTKGLEMPFRAHSRQTPPKQGLSRTCKRPYQLCCWWPVGGIRDSGELAAVRCPGLDHLLHTDVDDVADTRGMPRCEYEPGEGPLAQESTLRKPTLEVAIGEDADVVEQTNRTPSGGSPLWVAR
jgi:hypothetical protein